MGYPKCKRCGNIITFVNAEKSEREYFDGLKRIYTCSVCGMRCEANYNFELISPSQIYWEDEFIDSITWDDMEEID
jgi:hypothetical protein